MKLLEMEQLKKKEQEDKLENMLGDQQLDFKNPTQTRKALQMIFQDKSTPRPIRNLRFAMNIVMLFLITLSAIEFSVNNFQFDEVNENLKQV